MASEILRIAIDRFGRLVLPKEIRDRLGLKAGVEFEVEEQEQGIFLKPVVPQARLIEKDGLPVFSLGRPMTEEEADRLLVRARERSIL
ncbi:MAG: AbrB/MazE/SpoVT family DNA-binding domain-containing protein [Deltaproteobacteria bacterium]|nr:AbrB/MazE/SpoVT family DNA-binding domain-containing protein [Deltaproteobacteria bacterium]